jgi:hypothetical protein
MELYVFSGANPGDISHGDKSGKKSKSKPLVGTPTLGGRRFFILE